MYNINCLHCEIGQWCDFRFASLKGSSHERILTLRNWWLTNKTKFLSYILRNMSASIIRNSTCKFSPMGHFSCSSIKKLLLNFTAYSFLCLSCFFPSLFPSYIFCCSHGTNENWSQIPSLLGFVPCRRNEGNTLFFFVVWQGISSSPVSLRSLSSFVWLHLTLGLDKILNFLWRKALQHLKGSHVGEFLLECHYAKWAAKVLQMPSFMPSESPTRFGNLIFACCLLRDSISSPDSNLNKRFQ